MKTIYIILGIVTLAVLSSCEKVIEIDLKDAKQQIVVEANIYNGKGNNFVKITKSGSFYESNAFETVNAANVLVTNTSGQSYVLTEIGDGIYHNDTLDGVFLNEYKLNILSEGKTITSISTMPNLIKIDSLSSEAIEGAGGGPGSGGNGSADKINYKVYIHFTDPINESNYYRIKLTYNDKYIPDIFVIDDALFNGLSTQLPVRMGFIKGDKIKLELLSIDKSYYEYYRLLSENDMGAMSTSVGNPVSNVIGEDVIGAFGAIAIDSDSLILE